MYWPPLSKFLDPSLHCVIFWEKAHRKACLTTFKLKTAKTATMKTHKSNKNKRLTCFKCNVVTNLLCYGGKQRQKDGQKLCGCTHGSDTLGEQELHKARILRQSRKQVTQRRHPATTKRRRRQRCFAQNRLQLASNLNTQIYVTENASCSKICERIVLELLLVPHFHEY